jgi:hypothetical protein
MNNLRKSLERLVAFPRPTHEQERAKPLSVAECKALDIAEGENIRLAPVIAALLEVVEQAEMHLGCYCNDINSQEEHSHECSFCSSLERLRKFARK